MFINSNLKAKEKLIHDSSKIKSEARNLKSSISIISYAEQKSKNALHKPQNVIPWMIEQIEKKNQQHIIGRSADYISVDFQGKQAVEAGVNLQPSSSLKANAHIINRLKTQVVCNSRNNIIYFQDKSTTVNLEALVRAIMLQK